MVSIMLVVILLFVFLIFRLFFLTTSNSLKIMAKEQNTIFFEISNNRGNIYDRNYKKIVNNEKGYKGIVDENFSEPTKLYPFLSNKSKFINNPIEKYPYMVDLDYGNFTISGVNTFLYDRRYSDTQIMPHLVGYINKDNLGVSGLEKSYNDFLTENIYKSRIEYNVTGTNRVLKGSKKIIKEDEKKGIITTIDLDIQKIVEEVGREKIQKGAVLVSDAKTNEILASGSFPTFNPNNVENYIDNNDGALINRVLESYTVGSIFKLLVAGVALSNNIDKNKHYFCNGSITISGQEYGCHNTKGHGSINMKEAIRESCNPYFVNLVQQIPEDSLYSTAKLLGFGRSISLATSIIADGGKLPTVDELYNVGEKNSFSFGQGKLLATPLHISNLIQTILNDGVFVAPTLVLGQVISTAGGKIEPKKEEVRIFTKEIANFLRESMIGVINDGTGKLGKPNNVTAGGKTGTAQTGQYDENNVEYLNGWFTGFFPAEEPKYIITIMLDKGGEGGFIAAPIFKEIAERIQKLNL